MVVGIVVDQMKMEYLYRFSADFSANGFKLMNDGYTFHNMHYNFTNLYSSHHVQVFIQEQRHLRMELLEMIGLIKRQERYVLYGRCIC
jgi:hypothetical protein